MLFISREKTFSQMFPWNWASPDFLILHFSQFSSLTCSVAKPCLTLCCSQGRQHNLGFRSFTISQSLLRLMSTESVMTYKHLFLCCPFLLPSIFPSIRVFSSESTRHIRWPKYWSFSFSISPSSKYSGLISFRIAWFNLLAIQGTLVSLLQHYSLKTSILWC